MSLDVPLNVRTLLTGIFSVEAKSEMGTAETEKEFDDRLTEEVTLLSTKLVTAVARLLELEEKLLQMFKENSKMKRLIDELMNIKSRYEETVSKNEKLQGELKDVSLKRQTAETENTRLQAEVEDLTASLFNEANEMVSNASRETYNYKLKNRKLQEEIVEKNTIIDNLQDQLKDLKTMLMKMEERQNASQNDVNKVSADEESSLSNLEGVVSDLEIYKQQLDALIYSPTVGALRFDLANYDKEFKEFVYTLIKPDFHMDLSSLKNLKYFRRIWSEELDSCLPIIPSLSSTNFINRWQKGKTFWNILVEGKVIIEPVSGVNEHFKITYKGETQSNQTPVAIAAPCSFCAQYKDDMLEHCRLHLLKVVSSDSSSSHLAEEEQLSYPLCNYCLIKLRNICEFFAKLRLISSNVYRLKQNSFYSESNTTPNFQFKSTFSSIRENESFKSETSLRETSLDNKSPPDENDECILRKLYCMLILVRCKIFWSKIGFWDNSRLVTELNLEELHHEAFKMIVQGKIVPEKYPQHSKVGQSGNNTTTNQPDMMNEDPNSSPDSHLETSNNYSKGLSINHPENSATAEVDIKSEKLDSDSQRSAESSLSQADLTSSRNAKAKSPQASTVDFSKEPVEGSEPPSDISTVANGPIDPPEISEVGLSRKNSKSKQFKQKIENDLQNTMEMLQESIEKE